jgi:Peptidase S46
MRKIQWLMLAAVLTAGPLYADEGMWTFDNFPSANVAKQFGAQIDARWLDKVRSSIVRLSNCTATYVSPDGLILTNHHCADECLADNSTPEHSLIETGFLAADRSQEKKCGTQIADTLVAMENITDRVSAATQGQDAKTANETRKRTLTSLESACEEASKKDAKTGALKCESVNLYQGGQYFLYKYKRYTDVRLVFAPEDGIAAFGGDPDNFQFPRYCLDMSVLRAYENGKPAHTPNFLRIDFNGPKAGDVIFVAGHPGNTDRELTLEQLKFQRDVSLPTWLLRRSEERGRLIEFSEQSTQNQHITADMLNTNENSIKVRRKQLDALHDDALMARKADEQAKLRAKIDGDPALKAALGDPYGDIAKANVIKAGLWQQYTYLERGAAFDSDLFAHARALVRAAAERAKPNADRLREYTDAALPRLEQEMAAPVPIYPELERITMTLGLERMREWLGPDDPVVRRLLAKESPQALVKRVVAGSKLADPAVRMALWKGGADAVNASTDPMILLAKSVDADARAIRKRFEDEVEGPEKLGAERIAKARYAAYGTGVYPDATFTLRLNYGTVQGWKEPDHAVDPFTHLSTLFDRATGADPFRVPDSWLKVRAQLDPATPFNFSSNNDIVGGNSGSPGINAAGEVVGLLFDGNIHSISGSYWFDTEKNRAVAVDTTIIREALTKVYGANALYKEMSGT